MKQEIVIMERVVNDLAKKLGAYEYKELADKLVGVSFMQAFIDLEGYNLDEVDGFFDCNYKDISVTIWRTKFNKCMLNPAFDVWHPEISSPICEGIVINKRP